MPDHQERETERDDEYWNPYRFVEVRGEPPAYQTPHYRHHLQGLSGRIQGTITALTPLLIGDGRDVGNVKFISRNGTPFVPGTSLKGLVRSLVELVGNAAVPFPNSGVDAAHRHDRTSRQVNGQWQLDVAARMFGTLDPVFGGLVRFHDALLDRTTVPSTAQWPSYTVVVGTPKPEHRAFYPTNKARKFYHHKPSGSIQTTRLTQSRQITPAPTGARFGLAVDFENLRAEELQLLLYCLVLEEQVSVTLSAAALGDRSREPVTLRGPMRHKLGAAKPQGAGSIRIQATRVSVNADPLARYRSGRDTSSHYEEQPLQEYLQEQTSVYAGRTDATMQQLRAMTIFTAEDPRAANLRYPSRTWFDNDRERPEPEKVPLKPTL